MDWTLTSPRVLITNSLVGCAGMALVSVGAAVWTTDTRAQVLAMTFQHGAGAILQGAAPDAAPDEDSAVPAEVAIDIPARLRRQQVNYSTTEAPGTIVIDTPNTYLYYVLGGDKAIRYGVGVGRDGFTCRASGQ